MRTSPPVYSERESFQKYLETLHQLPLVYVPIHVLEEISSSIIIVIVYNNYVKGSLEEKALILDIFKNFLKFGRAERNVRHQNMKSFAKICAFGGVMLYPLLSAL
jgi:hypothetical protein